MKCKHGLNIADCSYCSGYMDNLKTKRQEQARQKHAIYKKIKEYQRISIELADRFNLPIEDWELELFIKNTSDVKDIDSLFALAIETQRSFNAMSWWWKLTYIPDRFNKCNHHAENIIERIKTYKNKMEVKNV